MNFAKMMKFMPIIEYIVDKIDEYKNNDIDTSPKGKITKDEIKLILNDLSGALNIVLKDDLI